MAFLTKLAFISDLAGLFDLAGPGTILMILVLLNVVLVFGLVTFGGFLAGVNRFLAGMNLAVRYLLGDQDEVRREISQLRKVQPAHTVEGLGVIAGPLAPF